MKRFLMFLVVSLLVISGSHGGLRTDEGAKTTPAQTQRGSARGDGKPAIPDSQSLARMEMEKAVLNRLVTELQHSPRSFIYLRSIGFRQTDEEFGQIIAANTALFRSTRIIRRDDGGKRQIPGWPGVMLNPEMKKRRK